jgi:hypothetical protein
MSIATLELISNILSVFLKIATHISMGSFYS